MQVFRGISYYTWNISKVCNQVSSNLYEHNQGPSTW